MKYPAKLLLIINGLAFVAAIAWLIAEPGLATVIAALTLLATLTGLLVVEKKVAQAATGQGGAAIRVEDTTDLHLDNQGIVRAGAGGTGGSGGDAIRVTSGVKVTIVNKGVIVGGNAGDLAPSYQEKWVDFRYPHDSGLQSQLENTGYKIAWCLDTRLSRKVDLEGWEIVTEPNEKGLPTRFRLKDNPTDQTLIKKLGA